MKQREGWNKTAPRTPGRDVPNLEVRVNRKPQRCSSDSVGKHVSQNNQTNPVTPHSREAGSARITRIRKKCYSDDLKLKLALIKIKRGRAHKHTLRSHRYDISCSGIPLYVELWTVGGAPLFARDQGK